MNYLKLIVAAAMISNSLVSLASTTEEPRTLTPLPNQAQCENIEVFTYGLLESHPIVGFPKKIQIVNDESDNIFIYDEWYRFYDSIATVYLNEAGDKVYLDDACYIEGKLLVCLQYNGCSYFF